MGGPRGCRRSTLLAESSLPCSARRLRPSTVKGTVGCSFDHTVATALSDSGSWPSCCIGFRVRMLSDGQSCGQGGRRSSGEASINRVTILRPWPQVLHKDGGWAIRGGFATNIHLQTTGFIGTPGAHLCWKQAVPESAAPHTSPDFHLFLPSSPHSLSVIPLVLPNSGV